jgi:uncharacterized membrane protein YgcG
VIWHGFPGNSVIVFVKRKVVDLVHEPCTRIGCGPWWTNHHDRPWSSPELGLRPLQSSRGRSDGTGRWRGGQRSSVVASFGGGEASKHGGGTAPMAQWLERGGRKNGVGGVELEGAGGPRSLLL